jgi:hypothetical protein
MVAPIARIARLEPPYPLAGAVDERQLVDLLLLARWYRAISFVARAARVANEPAAPRFADYTA